jgi:DNA-binding GntR family transcriptional regulator
MTKRLSYSGIATDLVARMRRGEFPRGAKIPSYRQLADSYGVSVATAQRAVRVLRVAGTVRGLQGRGVYVQRI